MLADAVLIHGGAGGVGHIAVQLVKAAGALVVATVSSEEKGALARSIGADAVVNYRTQTVAEYVQEHTDGKGFDVGFDAVGKENLAYSFEAAAAYGSVVSIMTCGTPALSPLHSKALSLHAVLMLIPLLFGVGRVRHGQILAEVASLVDRGRLRPLLDERRFHMAEVAAAHRHLESGHALGKVVLT